MAHAALARTKINTEVTQPARRRGHGLPRERGNQAARREAPA